MKPSTRAPFFACLYHGLCEVSRKHGYALTIHGTVTSDLDLVAIPWIDEAAEPEVLVQALMDHLGACDYPELLKRQGFSDDTIAKILAAHEKIDTYTAKPHGRLAKNLYMDFGAKVDLSIMPKLK